MDSSYLTSLCKFGAEVGTRLVKLAKNVDGMPSSVKSLGFEMWATCEVLCEFAVILSRSKKNVNIGFFNETALKDMEDYVETCDEIFHEAARGVIVAYERINALKPKGTQEASVDKKIYLSFGERTRWPLFQGRVRSMMEALVDAKMDMTLHLLVYWISWESEIGRRSRSSIFTDLSSGTRISLVNQLWNSKARRDQDSENRNVPSLHIKPPSISPGSSSMNSVLSATQSGSSSPSNTSDPASSPSSFGPSSESRFKKMGRFFARAMGLKYKKDSDAEPQYEPVAQDDMTLRFSQQLHSRAMSGSPSYRSDVSSNLDHPLLKKAKSMGTSLHSEHRSLLALTEGDPNALFQRPPAQKPSSWTAGPTKGFKQGIAAEWAELMQQRDTLENDEPEGEPRMLGRRLLFTQLAALTPYYAVRDDEESGEAVEMLLERWIEPGAVRTRVAEWERVANRRPEEVATRMGSIDQKIRFDFRRA